MNKIIYTQKPLKQEFHIAQVKHVSVNETWKNLQQKKSIILDIRESTEKEIEWLDIENIIYIPMVEVINKLSDIPKDIPVFIICNNGIRSTKIANLLQNQEFINVFNVDGGLLEWKRKDLPFEDILPDKCASCSTSSSCSSGTC